MAMLCRHGVRGAAAQTAHRLSTELVTLTRQTGREYAGAVDLESGAALPDILGGEHDEVDLTTHLAAMLPSRRYVQIHTHPGDSSFSNVDVAILLSRPELTAMIVLERDGTAHTISKTLLRQSAPHLTIMVEWDREFAASFEPYRAMVRGGQLTEREATKLHTHRVMHVISRRFHLRYSRIVEAFE